MLDALSLPPRLALRALDDLHKIADALNALVESVRLLPRTEDQLSTNIAGLRDDVEAMRGMLQPIQEGMTELRDTAEKLERAMGRLEAMLTKLPGL